MDIGTAKPSLREQRTVPHWGIDLVDPGASFSAAQFKDYTNRKIEEIRSRGNIPFLVGGTGLYVDAVVFDFEFGNDYDKDRRNKLQKMTVAQLQDYCIKQDISLPENNKNKRYLIRSIELAGQKVSRQSTPLVNAIIVGITTKKDLLTQRITDRAKKMFNDGVVKETIILGCQYGWTNEAMTGNVYPIIKKVVDGSMDQSQAVQEFIKRDIGLVRRQLTWVRRNPFIEWGDIDSCEHYLSRLLDDK